MLEEQVPLMGDMDNYFRSGESGEIQIWVTSLLCLLKEQRRTTKTTNQSTNQSINNSDSISIFNKSYYFNKLLTISVLYFLALAKFLANFQ